MTKRFENLGKHRWLNSKAEPAARETHEYLPAEKQPPLKPGERFTFAWIDPRIYYQFDMIS